VIPDPSQDTTGRFRWVADGPTWDGTAVPACGLDRVFSDRTDAEVWLTDHWPVLADAGADVVTLTDDGTPVYTMRLDA